VLGTKQKKEKTSPYAVRHKGERGKGGEETVFEDIGSASGEGDKKGKKRGAEKSGPKRGGRQRRTILEKEGIGKGARVGSPVHQLIVKRKKKGKSEVVLASLPLSRGEGEKGGKESHPLTH